VLGCTFMHVGICKTYCYFQFLVLKIIILSLGYRNWQAKILILAFRFYCDYISHYDARLSQNVGFTFALFKESDQYFRYKKCRVKIE
jgi:hypothetical protein